jgi:hypothetical protein
MGVSAGDETIGAPNFVMVIALSKHVTGLLKMCPAQSLLKGHVSGLQAMCTEE